ncbi:lipopolysaccharide heptosyltransferase II [Pseudodesulfovibrio sp. JC047]|uniref:lipopolysaccharide heptosyltransferase II n=1 Tax=Pseudodesulfovibrio sp. JC047 TaxID=2683199 RepID=UPI0013D804D6|nr:lipopolysaccharide heptosyltransferase II [Pseudodesulfovibrio sp. JC047]NDV20116.1 lipopolysaccharide heptosyltransferase II [Pseudodesulfovibrio sp. JC047]
MHEYTKIAVWQTAFLGDAVLTLPMLRAVRERFPQAEVHFFVRSGFESLFTGQPEITQVHGFAKRGAQKSLNHAILYGKELGKQGFDLWVSPHTSFRSALVSRATGIGRRIGYNAPWFNRFAYTETVSRRFTELDEIERLMELVKPLGIRGPAPAAQLTLSEASRDAARTYWTTMGFDRPVLGIHPGSTWPTKCWPVEYFSAIAARAVENGAHVLIFAGPGEESVASQVERGAQCDPRHVTNLAGTLSLPELAAYLGRLDAYLSNDSGPMHLAWTQDVPLVAVFGPTVRSLGFFPRGANSTVMEIELSCRPCGLHGSKTCPEKHFKCMKQVTPDMVWDVLRKKLSL